MNLFVQGMRRSGTTILYDALLEDPALRCFYEPLREEAETRGGGSGARGVDAFAETRALRDRFRRERFPELAPEDFNWGGPRAPKLELAPDLPVHVRSLLAHLSGLAPDTVIKETRLHSKVAALAELDPGAFLVHVVRDPRAVAASTLLGRGARRMEELGSPDAFFADRKRRKLWSSRELSEGLLAERGDSAPADPSNVERVLVVWAATFGRTWRDGRRHFGERYLLLRNEDLRTDPGTALERLYALIGGTAPPGVVDWAAGHVRAPAEPHAAGDPRWQEAVRRAGIDEELEAAGYAGAPLG